MNDFLRCKGAQARRLFEKYGKECDLCAHVEKDHGLVYVASMEFTHFGPLSIDIECKECYDAAQEYMSRCRRCKAPTKVKDLKEYRIFDPDVMFQDYPDFLCKSCHEGVLKDRNYVPPVIHEVPRNPSNGAW